MGGPSAEAEVSRRTGTAIQKALETKGYQARALEFNPSTVVDDLRTLGAEVVFNAIHGKFGEDGALQGLLEILSIPYTGSGIGANAVCMNKNTTKNVLSGADIPTAKGTSYTNAKERKSDIIKDIEEKYAFPVVLKAATQGSSLGVVIVSERDDLRSAIDEVCNYDDTILIEPFLDGDEFTVAVFNGKAMPVIKIVPHSGSYDYTTKYSLGASDYLVPAPISDSLTKEMQTLSEQAYIALGCSGMARVDVMTNEKGEVYILEVNTMPGMTETSLVPKAAHAMGISFEDLCEKMLNTAGLQKF